MLTLKGLVIRESDRGEASKSISILTAERGIVNVFIRGGKKSSKNASPSELFAYSTFCLEEKKKATQQMYYLNSCESEKLFYNIRLDAVKMALGMYFCELLGYIATEETASEELLRLTLNTFYSLDTDRIDMELLRAVFEFRLLCETGFRPALLGCAECLKSESDMMYIDIASGSMLCKDCYEEKGELNIFEADKTLLYTIRFIALAEYDRLFSFRLSDKYLSQLCEFTKKYLRYHVRGELRTLKFYKALKGD
ncbi:MAG: DNA repair protein RecO [Ruminococcus sp.]|nr:DNA repair protein RecO [Ruminococcus sp.]